MKKCNLLIVLVLFCGTSLLAQVKMGENIDRISPHALLELESTTKGFVIPRMTSAQRDAAFDQSTPIGTVIFNIDLNKMQYLHMWTDPSGKRTDLKVWEGATDEVVTTSEGGTPTIENPIAGDMYYDEENNLLYAYNALHNTWDPIGNTSFNTLVSGNEIHYTSGNTSQTINLDELNSLLDRLEKSHITYVNSNVSPTTIVSPTFYYNPTSGSLYFHPGTANQDWSLVSGTVNQTLTASSLSGSNTITLAISNGNTVTLDLSSLASGLGTNSQNITASLNANSLTLAISNGNTQTIDLSGINTDAQNIDALSFNSSTNSLTVGITGGASQTISLSALSRLPTQTRDLQVTNTLQVDGSTILNGRLLDSNGNVGNPGQVLSSTGTRTVWINAISGPRGPRGSVGPAGSAGANGQDGGGFLVGSGAPTSSVASPTFYVDQATGNQYYNTGGNDVWTFIPSNDNQQLTASALSGTNTMTIAISNGNTLTLDFSSLANESGVDSQTLSASALSANNTMTLAISDGNTVTLDLSNITVDTITGTLTVDNLVVSNTLTVHGESTLSTTTINGGLTTNGDTVNNGDLTTNGNTTNNGTTTLNGALVDSNGNAGTAGQVLSSTGTSTEWVDADLTDDQTLTASALSANNTMTLAISDGNTVTLDLSNITVDTITGTLTVDNLVVSNTLTVHGESTLSTTTINGGLTTNGDTLNNGDVTTTGTTTTNNLVATGDSTLASTTINGGLTANGTTTLNGALVDSNGNAGTAGQVLSSTGTSTEWVDGDLTDDQTLTASALSANNTMTLAISDGNTVTLDLSNITVDTITGTLTVDNLVVSNTLTVHGESTLSTTTINGGLTTNGDTLNNGDVTTTGTTTTNNLVATGDSTLASTTINGGLTSNGTTTLNGALVDSNGNAGTAGQVLSTTGTSTEWVDADLTDDQTLTASALSANNTMTLAISDGNTVTLDLGAFSRTDSQTLTASALSANNTMTLAISDGNTVTLDLGALSSTDSQTLTASALSANNTMTLAISDGNTVTLDLGALSSTDSQTLTFGTTNTTTQTTLEISEGNALTLQASGSLRFNQTSTNTLELAVAPTDATRLIDADGDTQIQVEEGADDDTIRLDAKDVEVATFTSSQTTINNAMEVASTLAVSGHTTLTSDLIVVENTTTSGTLTAQSTTTLNAALVDADGDAGKPGQVLSATSNGTNWISTSSGNITLTSSNYTAAIDDGTVLVQPTTATTITLPTPSVADNGMTLTVKRANTYQASGDTLQVVSSANIDGASTVLHLNMSFQGFTLQAFNGAWYITQRY